MIITGSPPVIASMCLYLLSSCRLTNLRFRRYSIVNVSDKRRDTTVLNKSLILPISPDSFSVNSSAMWRVSRQKLQGLSNYTPDAGMKRLGFKANVPREVGLPLIV